MSRPGGERGSKAAGEQRAIAELEAAHPEGLTASQIVDWFLGRGSRLSEATFRKWVQLGLLPRSRRVGRKGKHQGSLGLYPPSTVTRIAEVKRLMADNLTIEDIRRALGLRDEIETLERSFDGLWNGFHREIRSPELKGNLYELDSAMNELRRDAGELVRRIEGLERRIVTPLVRAAKSRAFGAGAGGGAGDLL